MLEQGFHKKLRDITISREMYSIVCSVVFALVLCRIAAHPLSALDESFHLNFTVSLYLVVKLLASFAGALTLGSLVFVTTATRREQPQTLVSYRCQKIAERASFSWFFLAVVQLLLAPTKISGVSVVRLVTQAGIGSIYSAVEEPGAWVFVAIFSAFIALSLRFTLSWTWRAWLIIPAYVACVAIAVTGNCSQGKNHDWTMGCVIIFTLSMSIAVGYRYSYCVTHRLFPSNVQGALMRRQQLVSRYAGIIAAVFGVVAYYFLVMGFHMLSSWYGVFGLVVIGFGIAIALDKSDFWYFVLATVAVMSILPAPLSLYNDNNIWDNYLGFELFQGPSFIRLFFHWRYEVVLGSVAILLLVAYVYGVYVLRKRGDSWPWQRTANWILGCLLCEFFVSSGFNPYGAAQFSVHMGVHMAMNMFVPIFLVLGAPVTLALRVFHTRSAQKLPGIREWILDMVHSRPSTVLTHPMSAVLIFVISLYGLYFTPLFGILVRYHWGHLAMLMHFLITGYMFFWTVIGVDPGPRRVPFIGRLGVLFAIMPFHAFFGVATMMMDNTIIGERFYRQLAAPWITSLISDQHLAGGLAWSVSEVPVVFVVIALLKQWAQQDNKDAKRNDRYAQEYDDREYEQYNVMLKQLAKQR